MVFFTATRTETGSPTRVVVVVVKEVVKEVVVVDSVGVDASARRESGAEECGDGGRLF